MRLRKHLTRSIIAIVLLAGALFRPSVSAQGSATASAAVQTQIVPGITLEKLNDLDFGVIVRGIADDRVVLNPTGQVSTGGSASILPGQVLIPARFRISGSAGYSYQITLPAAVDLINAGTADIIRLVDFTSTLLGNTGIIGSEGVQEFMVGGTLEIMKTQPFGRYSGRFTITANYE